MKKEEMCVNCVFCEMNNGVEYCAVTGGMVETDGYCLSFKKEKEKNERCAKCLFANLDHGILYCAVTGYSVKGDNHCLTYKPIEHNPDKDEYNESKVYIDPLTTRDEMACITAEIKSESYPKLSRLIEYLMKEYLVKDIQIEKVLEAGEEFYRAKLKYEEFPF